MMFLVGLSGGIATGKSYVTQLFVENDIPVIDADFKSREVVQPGFPAWKEVREHFGAEYFDKETDELLRSKLGELIFRDVDSRRALNRIIHPYIRKGIIKDIMHYLVRGHPFVVLDLPLLFESRLDTFMQTTIVVSCDEDVQLHRLTKRDSLAIDEAQQRIFAQMPLAEKVARANFVVDNNGTKEDTRAQVNQIIKELRALKYHWVVRSIFLLVIVSPLIAGYCLSFLF